MSNKENRIKSLPDVFMLASLVQFKYIRTLASQTIQILRLVWWGHYNKFGTPSQYDEFMDKY